MAKTTKEMIEVMKAYDKGKEIESYYEGHWVNTPKPVWDWDTFDYRVKQEHKKRSMTFDEIFEWWKSHRTEIIICKDDRYDIDSKGFITNFDFTNFLICLEENHYDEKEFYKYCTKEDGSKFEIVRGDM